MKHIKLFESFVNEKMLKKDLKKLADEIAAQIPDLPAFKKFKKGKNDEESVPWVNVNRPLPEAARLSGVGHFYNNYMRLNRNQESNICFVNNQNVELFRIVHIVSRSFNSMDNKSITSMVSSFQLIIGEKSYTREMPMMLPKSDTGYEGTGLLFVEELNNAFNSPGFAKLIKQYADAVNELNSRV